MDLCWQCLCFLICCLGWSWLFSKKQVSFNFMAALPSAVIWEPKKIVSHCFHYFPIYLPRSDGTRCHDLSFLNAELQISFFHFHQEAFQFLFAFCHKGSVICISEIIDISGNLDSSLCFIQLGISHDVFCTYRASLVAQLVKNLHAMWETWV